MRRTVVLLAAVSVLVSGSQAVSAADPVGDAGPVVDGTVAVTGDVRQPSTLTLDDLRGFPPHTQSVTFSLGDVSQSHVYVGAALVDVVTAAEPAVDAARTNPLLALSILAVGGDGYAAAVSWGELELDYAGTPVVVAYTEDGNPLVRPRLVVPGDLQGGRYVGDLTELRVVNLAKG